MSYSRPFTVTVTVAGNAGTGTFLIPIISGIKVRVIAIDAPVGAAYDWVLKDGDGYGLTGELAASGDETYYVELPMGGMGSTSSGSVVFANATNGAYTIRIWAEYN